MLKPSRSFISYISRATFVNNQSLSEDKLEYSQFWKQKTKNIFFLISPIPICSVSYAIKFKNTVRKCR